MDGHFEAIWLDVFFGLPVLVSWLIVFSSKPGHVDAQSKRSFGIFKKAWAAFWHKMATDVHFKAIWPEVFFGLPISFSFGSSLFSPCLFRSSEPGHSSAKPGQQSSNPGFPIAKPSHVDAQSKRSLRDLQKSLGRILAQNGHGCPF